MTQTLKPVAAQDQNLPHNIVSIGPRQPPVMDLNVMVALRDERGQAESQEIIEGAAFELSDRLHLLNMAMAENDYEGAGRLAKSIVGVSAHIGLSEFSIAADNLANCIETCDVHTITAVHCRVVHVGEMSLISAVELSDIPI